MPYDDLGPRYAEGIIRAGQNSGNWIVEFTPAVIQSRLPVIEAYHIMLNGPAGSSFEVLRNGMKWGASPNGFKNEWDPQQPMPLRNGDTVTFNWSTNVTPKPTVTLWLRTETSAL